MGRQACGWLVWEEENDRKSKSPVSRQLIINWWVAGNKLVGTILSTICLGVTAQSGTASEG